MIQPTENKTYIGYAKVIFSYFEGMKEGQGCFLMHAMRSRYHGIGQQDTLNTLCKVLYNLCINGYLKPKGDDSSNFLGGWINLTDIGEDYMHGGPLIVNKVDFNQYVSLDSPDNNQFGNLWSLIGEMDKAPFYLKGSLFLNMIRPYISEYIGDYMSYMDERQQHDLSTSRRVWYKELYLKIHKERRFDFLADLSYAVFLSFYYPNEDNEDHEDSFLESVEAIEYSVKDQVPELPNLNIPADNHRQSAEELLAISLEICNAYKSLIENNRLYRLLYNDDGTPKGETAAQLLFYSVAQGYCKQYDVDLNRESDPGIGELDFKLSVGSKSKVIIEMKLSSNSSLLHGFQKQLPAYLRAEDTKYGIYIVLEMNKTPEKQLFSTKQVFEALKSDPNNPIRLICIDSTPKPSASNI